MRMCDPEQRIGEAQVLQAHIAEHTEQNKNQKEDEGSDQPADKGQHRPIEQQKAARTLRANGCGLVVENRHGLSIRLTNNIPEFNKRN